MSFFGSFFNFNNDSEPFFFCSYSVFTFILFNETNAVSLPDEIADKITKTTNNVKLTKSTKFLFHTYSFLLEYNVSGNSHMLRLIIL